MAKNTSPKQQQQSNSSANNNTASNNNTSTFHHHASPKLHAAVPRSRTNSREYQKAQKTAFSGEPQELQFENGGNSRSYSHAFQDGIIWSLQTKKSTVSPAVFLSTYITLVLAVQLGALVITEGSEVSWSVTNAIHLGTTLLYIHWFKGNLLDEQGELNAMTLWEQLEAADAAIVKRTLLLVPTVLTYTACVVVDFDQTITLLNLTVWCVAMIAKLPFMNGVRIFGINRTAGIDDKQL